MKQISEELLNKIVAYYKSSASELRTALGITFPGRNEVEVCKYGKIAVIKRTSGECFVDDDFLEEYLERDDADELKVES